MSLHGELGKRWPNMARSRQILNIASELTRAKRWLGSDEANLRSSLERALELVDFCVADRAQWQPPRRRELLRWREALAAIYVGPECTHREMEILLQAVVNLDAESHNTLPLRVGTPDP